MQIPCVTAVIIGEIVLITATVCSISNCKEYARIIREIDKNPDTPKAIDQVLSFKFRSVVEDIVN
jgi:Na+/pantothenate symporter